MPILLFALLAAVLLGMVPRGCTTLLGLLMVIVVLMFLFSGG
jgi:predicted permease